MREHNCAAIGCRAVILPTELFCEQHDRMLQSDIRTILGRHYRPGRRHTKVCERALEQAQQEILFAQVAGYRLPREADFEW